MYDQAGEKSGGAAAAVAAKDMVRTDSTNQKLDKFLVKQNAAADNSAVAVHSKGEISRKKERRRERHTESTNHKLDSFIFEQNIADIYAVDAHSKR